jgi:hypothetical protein
MSDCIGGELSRAERLALIYSAVRPGRGQVLILQDREQEEWNPGAPEAERLIIPDDWRRKPINGQVVAWGVDVRLSGLQVGQACRFDRHKGLDLYWQHPLKGPLSLKLIPPEFVYLVNPAGGEAA